MLNLGGLLKHVNSHPLTLTLPQKIYSLSFKSKGHQWSCHLEAPGAMGFMGYEHQLCREKNKARDEGQALMVFLILSHWL